LRTIGQTLSRLFVNESLNATRAEPFQQWRNNDNKIRATRARNDANGLERLSGVHVRKGFYSRTFLRAWRKYSWLPSAPRRRLGRTPGQSRLRDSTNSRTDRTA